MYETLNKPLYKVPLFIVEGRKGSRYSGEELIDNIITFDIETTSYFIDKDGTPIMFDETRPEYFKDLEKGAICYNWQCSIEGNVFMGRELETFAEFLEDLCFRARHRKLFIYVHNLAWETHFLENVLLFDNETMRAREPHSPMSFSLLHLPVEFRCSYMLTNKSLAKWTEDNKNYKKLVGDIDYNVLRTPRTKLTPKERLYCINDVQSMYEALLSYRLKYKHIYNIPPTFTSEIRHILKPLMRAEEKSWVKQCNRIVLDTDFELYMTAIKAFYGGTVIANHLYRGETVSNVFMFDLSSSYPWVMLSEKYPCSEFEEIDPRNSKYIERVMKSTRKTYIVEFTAENVCTRMECRFLSLSKCHKGSTSQVVIDNGRIVEADRLTATMCKPDFEQFKRAYRADITINRIWVASVDYLPFTFRRFIVDKYQDKTQYKDVPSKEVEYALAKCVINALYGLSVSRSDISDELIFEQFDGREEWHKEELTPEKYIEKIIKKAGKNTSINYLTVFIGVFVTAYARQNLWTAINALDTYTVYCDTDSVKYIGDENADADIFNRYNAAVIEKHKTIEKDLCLSAGSLSPKDPSGIPHPIGVFANENPVDENGQVIPIQEFKALGAKKYIYRDPVIGDLHMTNAGVSKKGVLCLSPRLMDMTEDEIKNALAGKKSTLTPEDFKALYSIDTYKDGFIFSEKALHKCGGTKNMHTYLYKQRAITFPDGYKQHYTHGVHLMPTTYDLSEASIEDLRKALHRAAQVTTIFRGE